MKALREVQITDLEDLLSQMPHQVSKLPDAPGYPALYRLQGSYLVGQKMLIMPLAGIYLKESGFYGLTEALDCFFGGNEIEQVNSVRLKGEYMALYGWWAVEFFHWMLEWLPCVVTAERYGFKGKYIVPQGPKFILESLALLGISDERIIVHQGQALAPETLYVSQSVRACYLNQYPQLISALREKLIASALQSDSESYTRIYVARRDAKRPRKIVNEDNLIKILENYQFKTLLLEELSLASQIKAFNKCKMMVAPHGAGVIHALFMPAESFILEFFSPVFVNPCIVAIVDILNHRYQMLLGYYPGGEYPHGEDIEVYGAMVDQALRKEASTQDLLASLTNS